MSEFLTHTTTPLDVVNKADSIGVRAGRVRRYLTQRSATGAAQRSAKDELKQLIAEARDLWAVL